MVLFLTVLCLFYGSTLAQKPVDYWRQISVKSRWNSQDLGIIERISKDLIVWRKAGTRHIQMSDDTIWLIHVKDDTLKFNKGRTSVLRNLVQRLKSGAEHEYWLAFLVIFDDFWCFFTEFDVFCHSRTFFWWFLQFVSRFPMFFRRFLKIFNVFLKIFDEIHDHLWCISS